MNDSNVITPHMLSMLKRSDLETSYQALNRENINLRKALQQQINESNRLRGLLLELLTVVKHRKSMTPTIIIGDKDKSLQMYMDLLNEKVVVLTQQLLDHSRFHSEVHKCYKRVTWPHHLCMDTSNPMNIRNDKGILDFLASHSDGRKKNTLQIVEKGIEMDGNKRISPRLGDESNDMDTVLNNLDIIRLRRLIKRQAVQNATLSFHLEAADKQSQELRKELDKLQLEYDDLSKQMVEEKEKQNSLQSLKVELNLLRHNNKILNEEIRDIEEEKNTLKATNMKLLDELESVKEYGINT